MTAQVIVTTVFGSGIEQMGRTFCTFAANADAELHVFVYGVSLPTRREPNVHYHLVEPDPGFVSVRRDALFRRWTLPDTLDAEYALVVDGTDVICVRPLPPFAALLRGASLAATPDWCGPVALPGVGYTSTYLNAGVSFWHLPSSKEMRAEIVERGRRYYRGPFDDQTALNEVMLTKYFDRVVILPSQFNWRACYLRSVRTWHTAWRGWYRVDSLDGVYLYHNPYCVQEVLQSLAVSQPQPTPNLADLPQDEPRLSRWKLFQRRLFHRLRHT